ncbi:MAG TPA: proton-conducting transporter membrane subunit, partial [Verrucomicrobiales bacterium]|nr:proton-conducting transporter membrane subunit [Verrucomicrobiales bacterium]
STGLLVYGLAWLYGATGALDLSGIEGALATTENPLPALFALAFILAAMAFKVGALPTAFWIPDVYQGAPTPVTALLAVGSKSAGFIVLMRLMTPFLKSELLSGKVVAVLAIMAVATLLYGNFAALLQSNVKRLLGYSSISHAGFLVLALASAPSHGGALETPATTVAFYLASYAITALLAFLVLSIVSAARHGDDLNSFRGLAKASPFLALLMLLSMASMAGVPLTIGFWGKFFVFQQAVFSRLWLPLGVAVIGAAAGFYYYFRLIFSMYLETATGADGNPLGKDTLTKIGAGSRIAMILLALAIIGFGFFPGSILALLR